MERESAFRQIIDNAFDRAVEATVRQIISDKVGSALAGDLKDAVLGEAKRQINEDTEIRDAIRKRLMFWIEKQ